MKQATFAPCNHQLTSTRTWTPDSQWLVFDVRPSGASFIGETIKRVNVSSGTIETTYRATQGTCVSVIAVHPTQEHYVFIHDPKQPDAQWQYGLHHRHEVVAFQGAVEGLDVMGIAASHTPSVLCGGSHVHVCGPNGQFVSFTCNDHMLHRRDPALDLRNADVTTPYGPVTSQGEHPREYSGGHWCVLISHAAPIPVPGSDEVNRAYGEGWVGNHALVFIGDTLAENDDKVPELFIVGLPRDEAGWRQPGRAPLANTVAAVPAPLAGTSQRCLTFTHHRRYPGLVSVPRHQVRANPQATTIAFLIRDGADVMQLWLISPRGGRPRQLTYHASGTQLVFNWHPSGEQLGFVLEDWITCCHAGTGDITFLTEVHVHVSSADAIIFSPDGRQVAWMKEVGGYRQLWTIQAGR